VTEEVIEERRAEPSSFNVRSKILASIDSTDDKNQRNLLLLLFGVLEVNEKGLSRIEKKLDGIMSDEKKLRAAVLNGHEPSHHKHHDWIDQRISNDKFYTDFISRTTMALDWLDLYRQKVQHTEPICDWARRKMQEEDEDEKTKKSLVIKFLESIVSHVGTAVAVGIIAYLTLR